MPRSDEVVGQCDGLMKAVLPARWDLAEQVFRRQDIFLVGFFGGGAPGEAEDEVGGFEVGG